MSNPPVQQKVPFRVLSIVFLTGAALMALEIVGSRILSPYFGSTIYVWGSLIGIFIGSLSIGYYLGGRIADRWPSFNLLGGIILVSGLYHLLLPFFSPFLLDLFSHKASLGESANRWSVLGCSFFLFAPPSILLGCVSPIAIRLSVQDMKRIGKISGMLYAVSTIGSLVGTIVTSFLLIPVMGHVLIVRILGIVLLVAAGIALLPAFKFRASALWMFIVTIGLSGLLLALPVSSQHLELRETEQLVYEDNSEYHWIGVVEGNGQRSIWFYNFMQGSIELKSPDYPSGDRYSDLLWLPLIWQPEPQRAAFVGGGGGVAPRLYHKTFDKLKIDLVEIDQKVIDVAKQWFFLEESDRLKCHARDGRQFIKSLPDSIAYDIAVIDVFSSAGMIPFHLTTREYLQEVKAHLTENGILMFNVFSSLTGEKANRFQHILKTFESEFDAVYVFPKQGPYMRTPYNESTDTAIIGVKGKGKRLSKAEIHERAQALLDKKGLQAIDFMGHVSNYLSPEVIEGLKWKNVETLTDDWAPVDIWAW